LTVGLNEIEDPPNDAALAGPVAVELESPPQPVSAKVAMPASRAKVNRNRFFIEQIVWFFTNQVVG